MHRARFSSWKTQLSSWQLGLCRFVVRSTHGRGRSRFTHGVAFGCLQVVVPQGGNVTCVNASFRCPVGSLFVDDFGGLYGSHAYVMVGDHGGVSCRDGTCDCPFLLSTLQFGCQRCGDGMYTEVAGVSTGAPGQATNGACLLCPLGGSCSHGALNALPGYWGFNGTDDTVKFVACPSGYCCDGKAGTCEGMQPCAVGRVGTLCGECTPGHVTALGTSQCLQRARCSSEIPVFWSLFVVVVAALAAVLYSLAGTSMSSLTLFSYFLQMVLFIETPDVTSTSFAAAVAVVSSVLRLQLPQAAGSFPGVCIAAGLDAVSRTAFEACLPGIVGLALALLLLVLAVRRRCGWCKLLRPSPPDVVATADFYAVPTDESDEHYVDDPGAMSRRSRVMAVYVSLALLGFSVTFTSLLALLHCVRLEGADRRLFIAGHVACSYGGWQLLPLVALVSVSLLPVGVFACARFAMRSPTHLKTSSVQHDGVVAARRALVGPYVPNLYWWEAALLLHRAALGLLATFAAQSPIVQVLLFISSSVFALMMHLLLQPMRRARLQHLQTLLLSCLCVVAVCRLLHAVTTQLGDGIAQANVQNTQAALVNLTVVFGYVLPTAAFVCFKMQTWPCCRAGGGRESP